jgi:hypothetical protein
MHETKRTGMGSVNALLEHLDASKQLAVGQVQIAKASCCYVSHLEFIFKFIKKIQLL